MTFWLLSVVIAVLATAALVLAVLARRGGAVTGGNDVQVYRDQLQEVARDQARGVIGDAEAERLKLEVSRRLLEADRNASTVVSAHTGTSPVLAVVMAVLVFGGSYLLYGQLGAAGYPDMPLEGRFEAAENARLTRPSQEEVEALRPAREVAQDVDPAHLELMDKLREALKARPDELQGHLLLARNEASLGNFAAARRAQERIIAIKGSAASAADYADYTDLLVLATDGYVSPQAEGAIRRTLTLDPINGTGRYYLGLMQAQTGRPDLAFETWRKLLEESTAIAPWVPPIRAQIERVAFDAGVRYSLPELPDAGVGPSAGDVAAAQGMSEEERQEMIRGMVARLSERLATEGGSPQEWSRLIGALGVLDDSEGAAKVWAEAQQVFAASPEALTIVREGAVNAGVAE